jgi:hypothetical protein
MKIPQETHSLRQLKLVTGEEMLCQILDEEESTITLHNALTLAEDVRPDGSVYFTFRNFMVYQDNPMNVMLLMSDKIVSVAIPSPDMIAQYTSAIQLMQKQISDWEDKKYSTDLESGVDDMLRDVDDRFLMDSDTTGHTIQ